MTELLNSIHEVNCTLLSFTGRDDNMCKAILDFSSRMTSN